MKKAKNDAFNRIKESISKEDRIFYKYSISISSQIEEILEQKGMTQKDLAFKLGTTEEEISKWLSGRNNFTLLTIANIEKVLGEEIITTPQKVNLKKTI
jgi:ribosome-binding protein aMBF1 (putative translation factor)